MQQQRNNKQQHNSSSTLCKDGAKCQYGAKCRFAHPERNDQSKKGKGGKAQCKGKGKGKGKSVKGKGGGGKAPQAAKSERRLDNTVQICPICCENRPHMASTSCCTQSICYSCIKTMILSKTLRAQEITARWAGNARQCPRCRYGPIEHFACSDLSESSMNKCPSCSFSSATLRDWDSWDGTLPSSLQATMEGFDCPFCRNESTVSSAFGAETRACSKCNKMGHLARDCIRCSKCNKPGHLARDCTYIECHKCGKPGHLARDCTYIKCHKCGKPGHLAKDCRAGRRR